MALPVTLSRHLSVDVRGPLGTHTTQSNWIDYGSLPNFLMRAESTRSRLCRVTAHERLVIVRNFSLNPISLVVETFLRSTSQVLSSDFIMYGRQEIAADKD